LERRDSQPAAKTLHFRLRLRPLLLLFLRLPDEEQRGCEHAGEEQHHQQQERETSAAAASSMYASHPPLTSTLTKVPTRVGLFFRRHVVETEPGSTVMHTTAACGPAGRWRYRSAF